MGNTGELWGNTGEQIRERELLMVIPAGTQVSGLGNVGVLW